MSKDKIPSVMPTADQFWQTIEKAKQNFNEKLERFTQSMTETFKMYSFSLDSTHTSPINRFVIEIAPIQIKTIPF